MEKYISGNFLPYTYTISVKIDNVTKQRFFLPDDDILRGAEIVGLAIRRNNDQKDFQDRNGDTLIPDTVMGVAFLELEANLVDVLQSIPLDYLAFDANSDSKFTAINLNGFTPSRSSVYFADVTNFTLNEVVEITFLYNSYQPSR